MKHLKFKCSCLEEENRSSTFDRSKFPLVKNRSIDSSVELKSIDLHSTDRNLQGKINRSIDFGYFRKDLQSQQIFVWPKIILKLCGPNQKLSPSFCAAESDCFS
jgi:hypothetical protein